MSDVMVVSANPEPTWASRFLKRAIDIVGSAALIVLLLPVALVIAIAILIDSPGPVVFVQRRVGRGGADFSLVKFRTMRTDAAAVLADALDRDPVVRAEWEQTRKLRHDPRVTGVGGFIRRLSLDELPQLLNVFIGTMSLVGPRPVSHDEIRIFGEHAASVLSVRPGLTGLWAVSGRSDISYEDRVELEHRYVAEWSMWLDLRIMARTIPAVARGHGAY
jgi:exopolysaccharide production protein ExoY